MSPRRVPPPPPVWRCTIQFRPSYQKVFAREGVSSAVDLAVIGPAETVSRRLKSYLDAGAIDLALVPLQTEPAELRRLYEVAAAF